MESPEPISITRDVTLSVTVATRVWVSAPVWVQPAPRYLIHDRDHAFDSLQATAKAI